MKIQVTKEHIQKGTRFDGSKCPIALACKDVRLMAPNIGYVGISIKFKEKRLYFSTPKRVYKFIKRFDFNQKVKPFSFNLDV